MTSRRNSLLGTLLKALVLPGIVVAVAGVFLVHTLVKEEYDELLDLGLMSRANLLLTIFETSLDPVNLQNIPDLATLLDFENAKNPIDEWTLFWFLDDSGQIIVQSPQADKTLLPSPVIEGLSTAKDHRFAVIRAGDSDAGTVVVAAPMTERNEAITDVLIGMIVGFALLALLFTAAAFWAVRRSVKAIGDLSSNIAAKNEHNLSPIDRQNAFSEIEPAIDTLDLLMARLDAALTAERAFATNAAHELRTPVAICLAQVQRLKAKVRDTSARQSATEIELGLKRLVRLIERLLQMSRAQSGLGISAVETDITPVISLLVNEMRERVPDNSALIIKPPTGPWPSRIDPDALGIILSNLFENATKYATGDMPTLVDASQPGRVVVSNDCEALSADDLEAIKQRFIRKAPLSDGYGVGLSIVQELCRHSGCTVEITSPQQGKSRGFSAVLTLP